MNISGTLPPTGNLTPNSKASPSLSTHAKSAQSVNHDINTRVLTSRHACLDLQTCVSGPPDMRVWTSRHACLDLKTCVSGGQIWLRFNGGISEVKGGCFEDCTNTGYEIEFLHILLQHISSFISCMYCGLLNTVSSIYIYIWSENSSGRQFQSLFYVFVCAVNTKLPKFRVLVYVFMNW
jgi:hypothetical protein